MRAETAWSVSVLFAFLFVCDAFATTLATGGRVRLELMTKEDVAHASALFGHADTIAITNLEAGDSGYAVRSLVSANSILAKAVESAAEPLSQLRIKRPLFSAFGLRVVDVKSSEVIGYMSFHEKLPYGYWETSTLLRPASRGKGLGTEAKKLAHRFFFEQLQLPGLISVVCSTNVVSRKTTEKLGFAFVGRAEPDNAIDDSISFRDYRLSRDRFLGLSLNEHQAFGVSEKTNQMIVHEDKRDVPPGSHFSGFYRPLMADSYVRSRFSPEEVSVLAEEMTLVSVFASAQGAADMLQLWLAQRKMQDDLRTRIGSHLILDVIALQSKRTFQGDSEGIPQKLSFNLVATLADGSEVILSPISFISEGSESYTVQWDRMAPALLEDIIDRGVLLDPLKALSAKCSEKP